MALLGFERGVSVLAQVVGFARELDGVVDLARQNGAIDDPVLRDRLAGLKVELEVMRLQALRGLSTDAQSDSGVPGPRSSSWSGPTGTSGSARPRWTSLGTAGLTTAPAEGYELDAWQRLFLFSRADTIYGGSDEIQRNILAERVLGLPREPKGATR